MKRKKLTALLLTVAMTASVLAGCGGGDAGGSTETMGSPETGMVQNAWMDGRK